MLLILKVSHSFIPAVPRVSCRWPYRYMNRNIYRFTWSCRTYLCVAFLVLLAIHEVHTEGIVTNFSVWTNSINSTTKSPLATHTQNIWKERRIAIKSSSKNSREILHTRTALKIADKNNGSRDVQAGYKRNSDCLLLWLISRYNPLVNVTWRMRFLW